MNVADISSLEARGCRRNGFVVLRGNSKLLLAGMCIIFISFLVVTAGVAHAKTTEDTHVAEIQNAMKGDLVDEKLVTTIKFNISDLSFLASEGYDLVKLKDCQLTRNVGEPVLPIKSVSLVIPPTAEVTEIAVLSSEYAVIEGEYTILPARPPAPTSTLTYRKEKSFVAPKAAVYASSESYPGAIFRYTGAGNLRGHTIVTIMLFPLQYVPAEKKLLLYMNITLCVNYNTTVTTPEAQEEGGVDVAPSSGRATTHVMKSIFQTSSPASSDDVKYVIITNDDLKDYFQPLADWKTKKGVAAQVVTVSSITASYSGNDTQEQMRNFIKEAYTNWSTEWVLLGGDIDVVPHRGAYGYVNADPPVYDSTIPVDLYFSDLNGDWNADGDSLYGEVTDGVDLYPEVFVGRAPVNTIAEVQAFVNKTLGYEKNPPEDYERDMLFLAEQLDTDPITWGGDAKNIVDAVCIPPHYDPITKKYELYGNISRQITVNELNAGPHIVNHEGHGYTSGFGVGTEYFRNSDADTLDNFPKVFILYTISCNSNAFDANSLSEHFMNSPDGGSVAYIGNSRYGWYWPGNPGEGPSDLYDQAFFNSLFTDNFYHLGKTVADSKAMYIGQSQQDGDAMRWLQYAINLLGDPELPIWTDPPRNFTITKPPEITADTAQELVIQILNGTEPVENATVCMMKSDDGIYNVSTTDSSGNVSFWVAPSVGVLHVTVTKHNFIPNESTISVIPLPVPVISSPTHPDEEMWYCTRNATFQWTTPPDPSGIECYSYTLDNSSATTPGESCDTTENTTAYADVAYGIGYFHVRAKNTIGTWGPSGHFKIMIEYCDSNDGWYCNGDAREYRDYYCSGNNCTYSILDSANCSSYDGWVNTSNMRWVNDTACTEKEQQEQDYHEYSCDSGNCSFTVTGTRWIETGTTRDKPDGSDCGSEYYGDFVYYCSGDEVWQHRLLHDFYCDNGSCIDHTSWVDDQLVENCSLHDGWVNTSNTRWVNDTACTEKEQQEQDYHEYSCDSGNCSFTVTGTRWIETGTTRDKPDGSDCGCTVNNTLQRCYNGSCSDTGVCNATICNADAACDSKEPGGACGADSTSCTYSCECQGPQATFDTGTLVEPYPSIAGTHNGTLTPSATITVSRLYTYSCAGTGGHTEYARIWNSSDWEGAEARWNGYAGDWHNVSFDSPFLLEANNTYYYTIITGSYPQIHHTPALQTDDGWINCTEFVDVNGNEYNAWIPAIWLT
jgi:hypothetical protein